MKTGDYLFLKGSEDSATELKTVDDKYMALAEMYLWTGIGQKVDGLLHNLKNHVHVADMQLSMLASKSVSSGEEALAGFQEKLSRTARGTAKIVESLQKNGQFSFFSQTCPVLINVPDYLRWLLEFWENDLFFKHRIICELVFETQNINLQLKPFFLTLCLEQGIKNAIEAYQEINSSENYRLLINAEVEEEKINLTVTSSTVVPELDPWLEGSSSKKGHLGMGLPLSSYLAARMGWSVDLQRGNSETSFLLSISGI